MDIFKTQLADMSREELNDLRALLLSMLREQQSTRNLMFEHDVEGEDSDPRLELMEEKKSEMSPRSLSRSRYKNFSSDEIITRLNHARDLRVCHLPNLKELQFDECNQTGRKLF